MSYYLKILVMVYGFNEEKVEILFYVVFMYDIGKIGIVDSIMFKSGKLIDEEFVEMKKYLEIGVEIFGECDLDLFKVVKFVFLIYYEKWDGIGYFNGFEGEDIFIEGCICVVVDVFDVLISKCFYKEVWSVEKILDFMDS